MQSDWLEKTLLRKPNCGEGIVLRIFLVYCIVSLFDCLIICFSCPPALKTWWDCVKNDMESLGLSQKDAQFRNKWRRRIKGATG